MFNIYKTTQLFKKYLILLFSFSPLLWAQTYQNTKSRPRWSPPGEEFKI